MRVTIEKLAKSKNYPILFDVTKYLNQKACDKFHKLYMDQIYYHLSIQFDRSINILRDDSIKQPTKIFGNISNCCSCKEARWYLRQCVHEIILLNKFELTNFDIRWKDRDVVTCCHDVSIYKNPKITEHFKINDVDILKTDKITMMESYDETNNLTKENDESVNSILTETSFLSQIDDDKYI